MAYRSIRNFFYLKNLGNRALLKWMLVDDGSAVLVLLVNTSYETADVIFKLSSHASFRVLHILCNTSYTYLSQAFLFYCKAIIFLKNTRANVCNWL